MKIIYDRWYSNTPKKIIVHITTFEEAENLIIRLDQIEFTEVFFETDDAIFKIIGGSGNYLISLTTKKNHFELRNDESGLKKEQIAIINDSKLKLYSSAKIVTIEKALTAAHFFFKNGSIDKSLKWEKIH